MLRKLQMHPESRCAAVSGIEVEAVRPRPDTLALRYRVIGEIGGLRLPAPAAPERRNGLWRHTCLEAFLRTEAGPGYCEFNFSPSTEWAAYGFDDFRTGMRALEGIGAPQIEIRCGGTCLELHAALELDGPAKLPSDAPWRLGLSAIVEERDGNKSYWALAHPKGKPDFHHSDCFALELAPA